MTTLRNVAEEVAEESIKKATIGAKEYIAKNGVSEVPSEADLSKEKMNIGISVDGAWGSRGWASKQGIADVCFEDTGKVLDVILKTSHCKICKNLKHQREIGKISLEQYIDSYKKHEPDCLLNHEESASLSENLLYHCRKYSVPSIFTANPITSKTC